jgi:hypothetical protein
MVIQQLIEFSKAIQTAAWFEGALLGKLEVSWSVNIVTALAAGFA